ncbi:multiple sugar transport system substrate-binding protein [Novosphingobium capsulatum]|uniref:Multiple sugar transport system substrate-binding protein n=1 Tax=Novosphingobium capsulatum TaxID=13688 RepID=A0ABU1MLP4_9SPHN|nr:carbohydrate ABC transporter substrate-binding protein [Novosphingobium capsulatum]MDR6511254.1 multiple sugar transport system substrate-binding protein [Novosphingobium capsulatum]
MSETTLKGMTWDHPRGYDPLVAASREWARLTGTAIEWERRSLQAFETHPVEDLARAYDLVVIDHPHVGIAAQSGALLPFAGGDADAAAGSVGGSYESYAWDGRQWALPIDAAAQVQAWVPGRLPTPLRDWGSVLRHAEAGGIGLPLRAPHSLMSLMTLCGLMGLELCPAPRVLFPDAAAVAVERLYALAERAAPGAAESDPIAVLEAMARADSPLVAAPLIYGYVSYAQDGFRPVRLAFADLAPWQGSAPRGSVLGGTGIAVSRLGRDPAGAMAFARWLAGGPVQTGIVAANGGQPAHAQAWADIPTNATTGDFYRATRATLDHAWIRPRHAGYMPFQDEASGLILAAIARQMPAESLVSTLNRAFAASVP